MSATNVRSTENKRVLRNEKGNMVLPILGIFLVIGIMLQSSELVRIAQSNSITANTRIRDSRNALTLFLSRYSALPAAYRNSVVKSDNADLQSCVLGSATNLCYADGREYPMNLYAPSVDGAPAKLLASAAVGTQSQPVLYNNKGQLCETGAKSATVACPFEVTSTFKATCAGGATSCAKAESIFIQYKIHTPENLYNDSFVKNRLVLATVENTAASVAVKNILPPSYDYVPNSVTVVSYITNTTETAGTTTMTYEQIYAIVLAAIGGSNPTLIGQIANKLTMYRIYNADLITWLAQIWVQNALVADRYVGSFSTRIYEWTGYVIPTPTQLTEMAKVPLALASTNQTLAAAIASGAYPDSVLNQKLVDALAGITDYQVMLYVVSAKMTSTAQAQAMNTAVLSTGLYGNPAYVLAQEVTYKNITDGAYLTTLSKVIIDSGATGMVERAIIEQGITDLNVAKQMVAAAGGTTTTTTASTTSPTTSTTTTTAVKTTTTTTTTTASTVPVTMTAACTSTIDCGTTIGM